MFDPTRLLGGMLWSGIKNEVPGLSGAALGMGALGVAFAAFEHFTSGQQASPAVAFPPPPPPSGPSAGGASGSALPPPPPGTPGMPSAGPPPPPPGPAPSSAPPPAAPVAEQRRVALLLTRAMIAAAFADGQLDKEEREAILGRMNQTGIGPEEKAFLVQELLDPPHLDALLPEVNSPAVAEQFYLATILAIRVDTDAERQYVATLAARLGLTPETVARLNQIRASAGPQ